ncbi:MAG: hypothetical protein ACD_73C00786G0001 [uncultured bacterium]|nr:MAG: hypothetical protein ACD_73C00786G0001 [uncultured bacterium]
MKNLLIKNGLIVDPANGVEMKGDVLVREGKIAAIGSKVKPVGDEEIIDANGLLVSPGFVDLHTHLREPGFEYKETILTGTQSAAAGGFTSICCMANTNPVNDQASVTHYILKQARDLGVVNVYPIGALTKKLEGKELSHMGELKKAGCVAVSDDGKAVANNALMRLCFEYAKTFDLLVITHSVDDCLTNGGVMHEGAISTKLGLKGIPNQAEDIMIARDLYLAQLTGARLHVAHVSTKEGVDLIRRAKKKGCKISCEVTPHHFTLTDAAVKDYDTDAKMMPPLRSQEDRLALIEGLKDGTIDAIATDHAPHAPVDKDIEFDIAPCGVVGLESAFSLSYQLVLDKQITLKKLVELLSFVPAQVAGLAKGSLSVGADADITVIDLNQSYQIDPQKFKCKSKNSPFTGLQVKGKIVKTIVGGKVVYAS